LVLVALELLLKAMDQTEATRFFLLSQPLLEVAGVVTQLLAAMVVLAVGQAVMAQLLLLEVQELLVKVTTVEQEMETAAAVEEVVLEVLEQTEQERHLAVTAVQGLFQP
jgi:hypothetical protein